ncbi:phosphatases II [Mytilinidion resinicola]|uniref:Phosphatases II n=1 Tax=Mytilinidion resinicola TaxID=574789 RepID=A0A6A6YJI7_9PEZI|nr:phosphatases II [Mytilinidion resinicola]KAF2808729.1 phosphatases II [Mytilinidion resinicola]
MPSSAPSFPPFTPYVQHNRTPLPPRSNSRPLPASVSRILPFLFLGPVSATSNGPFLTSAHVTHILSIGKSPAPNPTAAAITYHRLGLLDKASADMAAVVAQSVAIIDAVERDGGVVLVHCSAAISRSLAVVAAYLMLRRGKTLRAALEELTRGGAVVAPNAGFLRQLGAMEESGVGGKATVEVGEGELEGTRRVGDVLGKAGVDE